MIEREHDRLSVSRQCRLVGLSRSTLYYRAKGESAETLALMRRIDEVYLEYPFYGSRQIEPCLAPPFGANVLLAGVQRLEPKLHRSWPGGRSPARAVFLLTG